MKRGNNKLKLKEEVQKEAQEEEVLKNIISEDDEGMEDNEVDDDDDDFVEIKQSEMKNQIINEQKK